MRLISLKIYKKKNGEVIRDVKFNEHGLSLICDLDGDENRAHGSSIGKTAFIRCIDICLGAKTSKILYESKGMGENVILKDFIYENQVSLMLMCENDGASVCLERNLFDNKEYVNGEKFKKIEDYNAKLKEIFFPNSLSSLSFRQLIPLFIRIDNEEPIKYLDNFAKNNNYYYAYSYFLNLYVDEKESSLNDELLEKEEELKKLEGKYKIKYADDFDKLVEEKDKIVKEKKSIVHNNDYVGDFSSKETNNAALVEDLDRKTDELNAKRYKSRQLTKVIEAENSKLFEIDEGILKELYDDANENIKNLSKSFREFTSFHNDMCLMRKNKFVNDKKLIDEEIKKLEIEVENTRKSFCDNFIEFKISVDDKENSLFDEYYSAKKEYEETLDSCNKYKEIKVRITEIKSSLSKIDNSKAVNEENQYKFSSLLKEQTEKLLENSYTVKYSNKMKDMIITLKGLSGNLGTGDGKVLSYAINSSLYRFFLEKHMTMPFFIIQDRMENVEIIKMKRIIEDARQCGIQYIIPILHDRIENLEIDDSEIILKLSKNEKLFKC